MKVFVFITIGLFLLFLLFLSWGSYPWSLKEKKLRLSVIEVEKRPVVDEEKTPSVLKVLSFNLGFLYGEGSEGVGYEHRERSFYKNKLEKLSLEIKAFDPDVIFLQEVDFESSRSHFINQAFYLAKNTGYPFLAQGESWRANYIPFPYWPFKNHFGQMSSGGAILSRYPLKDHQLTLLEKPLSNPWWYNLFYLHRYFQQVTVVLGKKSLKVVNLHLEAFDKKTRQDEIHSLLNLIKEESVDLVAGDFNMLPPSAQKKGKFKNGDDYENDSSYSLMAKSSFLEVVPDEIYAKQESLYFSFPASRPDRRLDYIWYKEGPKMMKAEILPSALSDHLPLKASFQLDGPHFNPYSQ